MMLRIFAGSLMLVFVGAAGRGPLPAGTISGKVTYTGTPPKSHPIDMAKEPNCVTQHPTPVTSQDAVTGPGNSLRYVVVYISAGDQGAAPAAETGRHAPKGSPYYPHIAAMHGHQPLRGLNNSPHPHNLLPPPP